jgi:hypothetical protein
VRTVSFRAGSAEALRDGTTSFKRLGCLAASRPIAQTVTSETEVSIGNPSGHSLSPPPLIRWGHDGDGEELAYSLLQNPPDAFMATVPARLDAPHGGCKQSDSGQTRRSTVRPFIDPRGAVERWPRTVERRDRNGRRAI